MEQSIVLRTDSNLGGAVPDSVTIYRHLAMSRLKNARQHIPVKQRDLSFAFVSQVFFN